MINLRSVLFLTSLVFITAIPCFSSHTDITPEEARDLIDSTDTLIILDVSEPLEYCGGHIAGAVNYPWNSGVLEERYEELINNEILVVCKGGGRSNEAANFLDSKDYTLVYDMLGGMNAWQWEIEYCVEAKYSGGKGTADDPYQIATAEDLITLGETPEDYDKHFILTADIDLDPNLPDGQVFVQAVIPKFAGVFDGNDHVIFDLKITGGSYIGLFGRLEEAEVKDLGLVDVNITASGDYVGGLAGFSNGDISNCYSTGAVAGNKIIGGLVGDNNEDGAIFKCYSTGSVSGDGPVGGLVGQNGIIVNVGEEGFFYGGWIDNCYSTCSVTGNTSVGGLVGCNEVGAIINCYSSGSVFGNENVGGFIGDNNNQVTDCFWDMDTSGVLNLCGTNTTEIECDDSFGKTTAEMQMAQTFTDAGWDLIGETENGTDDIWWILEGWDYPRLWWQLPADDFEDGQPEPLWFVYNMEPELAWLEESNGRLEINTTGSMENVDATYVSDGWRLDANEPFAFRVDFHFSRVGAGDGRMTLGLVPTIEEPVQQWAQFEVGTFDDKPFYLYEVRDGDWVREQVDDRFVDDGILYISYDPDTDELYLSDTGYGQANARWTITALVRGRWQSESIYVALGGGSEDGMALTGEDARLDNFTVDSGAIRQ